MRKSPKKGTIGWYKKEFWKVFSLYIRTRDNFTCITCGKKGIGSGMHAGHFIPKAAGGLSLYFNEDNVHAQCYHCNVNLGGFGAEYYIQLLKKIGKKKLDKLFELKNKGFKEYTIEDYKKEIIKYQKKYEKINKSREKRKGTKEPSEDGC